MLRRKFGIALSTAALAASAMALLPGTASATDGQLCDSTWDQVGPYTFARECINRSGNYVSGMTIFHNAAPGTQYLKTISNYIVTSSGNTAYTCSPSGWLTVNYNQDMGCAGPWIYVGAKSAYAWTTSQDWYSGGSTISVSPTSV
jgi:hypothetical protein